MWAQWHVSEVSHGVLPYFDPDINIAKGLRVIAHGIAPCFGGWHADIETWKDSTKATFDEFKKRQPYMTGETAKYSAILVSQQMRDFYDSDAMWNSVAWMENIHRANHLLTDVIFDDSLTPERLASYSVVSLANSTCLSDAQCTALADYVRHGGTLLATAETSLYDEWGNRREDFGLSELLGVHYVETRKEASQILVPQTKELKATFKRFVTFVSPSVHIKQREDVNTELLFTHSSRSVHGLSLREDSYDSDVPAILCRHFGKGTVYYIGPNIGRGFGRDHLPRVTQLVGGLLRDAAEPPVEFDAPQLIEITALRPHQDRLVLHLLNVSALSSNTRKMSPLANISIKVNRGKVVKAKLTMSDAYVKVRNNQFVVPSVGHSEVVVLNME